MVLSARLVDNYLLGLPLGYEVTKGGLISMVFKEDIRFIFAYQYHSLNI